MALKLTLGFLACCGLGSWSIALPVAPAPRKIPALKCEVRWIGGKREVSVGGERITVDLPDRAEVTITNISNADMDIGSMWGPFVHLDLKVKDPAGKGVKSQPYGARFSLQSFERKPYILKPGKSLQWEVCLLSGIPEEKLVAGTYKVRAVYTIRNKEYESAWVEVKWPGKKK